MHLPTQFLIVSHSIYKSHYGKYPAIRQNNEPVSFHHLIRMSKDHPLNLDILVFGASPHKEVRNHSYESEVLPHTTHLQILKLSGNFPSFPSPCLFVPHP